VSADPTTAEGAAEVNRSVLQRWGGADIPVNVVGGSSAPGGGFAALDDAQWFSELNLNLMPAVRMDRARRSDHLSGVTAGRFDHGVGAPDRRGDGADGLEIRPFCTSARKRSPGELRLPAKHARASRPQSLKS
jgi:hypothetical protein